MTEICEMEMVRNRGGEWRKKSVCVSKVYEVCACVFVYVCAGFVRICCTDS